MSYFDLLPQELINEILSYFKYDELIEIEESFDINYETVFSFRYKELYNDIKQIIKFDQKLKKYSHNWALLYQDEDRLIRWNVDSVNSESLFYFSSVYLELINSIKLRKEYPLIYEYKYKNNSPYFVTILLKGLRNSQESRIVKEFIENGKLIKDITFNDLNIDNYIKISDLVLLNFIFWASDKFKREENDIEILSETFENEDESHDDFVGLYRLLIEILFNI